MTNYKLEDFKTWLEEDPTRKGGLDWRNTLTYQVHNDDVLKGLIDKINTNNLRFDSDKHWIPYRQVAIIWKLEQEINQIKQKLTNLIQQRKNQITQELTLLRDLLRNSHE